MNQTVNTISELIEQRTHFNRTKVDGIVEVLSGKNVMYLVTKEAKENNSYQIVTDTFNFDRDKNLVQKFINPIEIEGIKYSYVICPDSKFRDEYSSEFVAKETILELAD